MHILAALVAATAVGAATLGAQATDAQTEAAASEAATEGLGDGAVVLETELGTEGASEPEEKETEAATEEETGAGEKADGAKADQAEGETEDEDPMEAYRALDYVTLGEYKGLAVELGALQEVTDAEIDAVIKQNLLDGISSGQIPELTEGTVQMGDVANIDYKGMKDGEAFDGGTAEGYDLEIGSGTFIEGFEDGIVGMQVGEEKDLNLTFPEQYHSEELAGQDVVFHVKVNAIKRPELTDETAAALEEGMTADEYRESVRKSLEEEAEEQRKDDAQVELLNQVFANAQVDGYPTSAFDYEFSLMKQYYETMATYYGTSLEEFLELYGTDLETLEEMQRSSLTQEMILLAVAEQEGMELDEAAYEEGATAYAASAGVTLEEFEKQYSKNYIRNFLLIDMAVEFLTENANFVEPEERAEGESEAESAAEAEDGSEAGASEEAESDSEADTAGEAESASET